MRYLYENKIEINNCHFIFLIYLFQHQNLNISLFKLLTKFKNCKKRHAQIFVILSQSEIQILPILYLFIKKIDVLIAIESQTQTFKFRSALKSGLFCKCSTAPSYTQIYIHGSMKIACLFQSIFSRFSFILHFHLKNIQNILFKNQFNTEATSSNYQQKSAPSRILFYSFHISRLCTINLF